MFHKKVLKRPILNMRKALIFSTIFVVLAATAVFGVLRNYLEKINLDVVSEINMLHMQESNNQIQHHFNTIINFRISQAQGLLSEIQNHSTHNNSTYNFSDSAKAFDFEFIGMYQADGTLLTLYPPENETVGIINEEPFRRSLRNDINKVALGKTQSGKLLFLQGVAADFSVGDKLGTALITGRSMDFLNEELDLQGTEDGCTTHIIRTDGSFVIKNDDTATENNYLERISVLAKASDMDEKKTLADVKRKCVTRKIFHCTFPTVPSIITASFHR